MDKTGIVALCKELGCCDTCCLRFLGYKTWKNYGNVAKTLRSIEKSSSNDVASNKASAEEIQENITEEAEPQNGITPSDDDISTDNGMILSNANGSSDSDSLKQSDNNGKENVALTISNSNESGENSKTDSKETNEELPPAKRCKKNICSGCLGVLQEDMWAEAFETVKETLEKKRYQCNTFACGLSSPITIILREKAITLRIRDKFPNYEMDKVIALKEAWKWTFAVRLATHVDKALDSGAVCPLLVTLNYDYPDEIQELEILKAVSPALFASRKKQKRRFTTEFTRRCVEQALEDVTLPSLISAGGGLPLATAHAKCVSVVCTHSPVYLGGRYIKLSRNLPQSPWILDGRRVLPTSVQEIIFKPIADIYEFDSDEMDHWLKFVAAGREDVDVRCLGDGRPFAIEITDPRRALTAEELQKICEEISKSGDVIVKSLVPISRNDLTELKKGEETKSKTYEALCIKLTHSEYDDPTGPVRVTDEDIKRINEFRNTEEGNPIKIEITQKTPIRVLHRRPLLTRKRGILELTASMVPEHPRLVLVCARTSAGTYVKEWAHGELARTRPALRDVLAARAELLALDVARVHLAWPAS